MLHRFPHYKLCGFYISGESYAGHYVPQLVYTVIRHNGNPRTRTKINLKGIMFGNGVLNNPTDSRGRFDYLWSHALISDRTHAGLIRQPNCEVFNIGTGSGKLSAECIHLRNDAGNEFGNINLYNIYYPLCISSASFNRSIAGPVEHYDPCSDDYVYDYLNNANVQAALHARATNWSTCSAFNWTDSPTSVLPIVQ